jgi:hypothetical protein
MAVTRQAPGLVPSELVVMPGALGAGLPEAAAKGSGT